MIKQLLDIVFNVSEQMVLVDFVVLVVLVRLIRFSSLSISGKASSLSEMFGIFFNVLLISKTLGWFLYFFVAFQLS